jgi:hypothetical protein
LLRTTYSVFALALAILSAQPAAAQQTPAAQTSPKPDADPTELSGLDVLSSKGDPVASFVTSYAAQTKIGQLATWREGEGICPKTYGVDEVSGDIIVQRIRTVAVEVGAPVRNEPCKPNVVVQFTDHAQAQLDQILKTQPVLFGPLMPGQAKQAAVMKHPIQAWYLTETVNKNGRAMVDNTEVGRPLLDLRTGRSIDGAQDGTAGSLLFESLESHFATVLIVVDATMTVLDVRGPLADYLAMVSLAQTSNFDQCHSLPSITNLTGMSCPGMIPAQLTDTDLAYLRGLYAVRITDKAAFQKGEIAKRIKKDTPH